MTGRQRRRRPQDRGRGGRYVRRGPSSTRRTRATRDDGTAARSGPGRRGGETAQVAARVRLLIGVLLVLRPSLRLAVAVAAGQAPAYETLRARRDRRLRRLSRERAHRRTRRPTRTASPAIPASAVPRRGPALLDVPHAGAGHEPGARPTPRCTSACHLRRTGRPSLTPRTPAASAAPAPAVIRSRRRAETRPEARITRIPAPAPRRSLAGERLPGRGRDAQRRVTSRGPSSSASAA